MRRGTSFLAGLMLLGGACSPLHPARDTHATSALTPSSQPIQVDQAPVRWPGETSGWRFDRQYRFPTALVSNPSDLEFLGRTADGRLRFVTVLDGSALSRDLFLPSQALLELVVDPKGELAPEVNRLPLDLTSGICDLEAISVIPDSGHWLLGDERVAGLALCGGTGPKGEAASRISEVNLEGAVVGGPWEIGIPNRDNDGIEAMAVQKKPDGLHIFALEERKAGKKPIIQELLLTGGRPPMLLRTFALPRPKDATQSAARFDPRTGKLLVADRTAMELLEVDVTGCQQGKSDCLRATSLKALTVDALRLWTPKSDRGRIGLIEGLALDDEGALYLLFDNNSSPFEDGDASPRLIRLVRETAP